jgi:hypothetical protein
VARTDGHLTLAFHPTPEQVLALQADPALVAAAVPVELRALCTVFRRAEGRKDPVRLQFCVAALPALPATAPGNLHITLGSTDVDALPHALSGQVLAALSQPADATAAPPAGAAPAASIRVSVNDQDLFVHVEPFQPWTFLAKTVCVCHKKPE